MVAAAAFVIFLILLHKITTHGSRKAGSMVERHQEVISNTVARHTSRQDVLVPGLHDKSGFKVSSLIKFGFETPKPSGSNYTKTMVVSRLSNDNISWIGEELPGINATIYVANDPTATVHPPMNKGHEVMIYLTYIIDHYFDLPDTMIFMHAHRWTHHNIELLGYDSAQMVRRLSDEYVAREGYVNMRCKWHPGCPEWLHPADARETLERQEGVVLPGTWHELFPSKPVPQVLSQGCCAQFALSKNRVLSIPLSRYVFCRDWVLKTPLSDYISGRIWEYLWQLLFTGESTYCPAEDTCHCQGFGVCFGGNAEYRQFEELRLTKEAHEMELKGIQERQRTIKDEKGGQRNLSSITQWEQVRLFDLTDLVKSLEKEINVKRQRALDRGEIFRNQAGHSDEQKSQSEDL